MDKSDSGKANECPTDIKWKFETTFRCAKKKRNTDDVQVQDGILIKSVDDMEDKNLINKDGISEHKVNDLKDTSVYDNSVESITTTEDTVLNTIEYTSFNTLEYTSFTTKESLHVNLNDYTSSKAFVNQES